MKAFAQCSLLGHAHIWFSQLSKPGLGMAIEAEEGEAVLLVPDELAAIPEPGGMLLAGQVGLGV